jgi:hypothetical protein
MASARRRTRVKFFTPFQGVSLIEAAICIVVVFITIGALFQMLGGKTDITQNNENFASYNQYLSFKNREYVVANSLLEGVLSGQMLNNDRNPRNGCPVPIRQNNMLAITAFLNRANIMSVPNFGPGPCVDNTGRVPVFYRWSIRRVITGNPTSLPSLTNPGANPNGSNFISIPRRVFFTGNAVDDDRSYNEYYIGTLNTYASRQDATTGANPTFTVPFSFYVNNNEPERIQASIAAGITMDGTISMGKLDSILTPGGVGQSGETGLSRISVARIAMQDFVRDMEQDPFVADDSVLSLARFSAEYQVLTPMNFPQGNFPNRQFTGFRRFVNCFRPREDDDAACSGIYTIPNGTTSIEAGLLSAFDPAGNALGQRGLFNFSANVQNVIFRRNYDRVFIFVTDGAPEIGAGADTDNYSTNSTLITQARRIAADPAQKDRRISIFTVGILPDEVESDRLLRNLAAQSPNGLYFRVNRADQLVDALQQIGTQFQYFALRRKTERFGINI